MGSEARHHMDSLIPSSLLLAAWKHFGPLVRTTSNGELGDGGPGRIPVVKHLSRKGKIL